MAGATTICMAVPSSCLIGRSMLDRWNIAVSGEMPARDLRVEARQLVENFANFNKTYGSLGAIVGLLFWFYVSAFVVLLGAELNAEMELQTERDTTTGPPAPMGERGALCGRSYRLDRRPHDPATGREHTIAAWTTRRFRREADGAARGADIRRAYYRRHLASAPSFGPPGCHRSAWPRPSAGVWRTGGNLALSRSRSGFRRHIGPPWLDRARDRPSAKSAEGIGAPVGARDRT